MTTTTRNLRRPAQFAVSLAGLTPTALHPPLRPTAAIASTADTSARNPADQPQSYAAALRDAYARIEISHNPALAALAANLAQLAQH